MPKATVFFDLETGGLESWRHPIIQMAAVVVNDQWQELATFDVRVKFDESKADRVALAMNRYDTALWSREAISERVALDQFTGLLEQYKCLNLVSKKPPFRPYSVACLAGHNAAGFDVHFLTAMYKRYNKFPPYDHRVRDTMQLALWWLDRRGILLPSYRLTDLCKYFGIEVNEEEAHDALYDVRLSIALAKAVCSWKLPLSNISQQSHDSIQGTVALPDLP